MMAAISLILDVHPELLGAGGLGEATGGGGGGHSKVLRLHPTHRHRTSIAEQNVPTWIVRWLSSTSTAGSQRRTG